MSDYDRAAMARRILRLAGQHDAVSVGTSARSVEVDPDTMTRLLDLADCPACDNCGHPDYCHGKWAWWKLWRRGTTWCDHQWKAKTCTCQHWAPF